MAGLGGERLEERLLARNYIYPLETDLPGAEFAFEVALRVT